MFQPVWSKSNPFITRQGLWLMLTLTQKSHPKPSLGDRFIFQFADGDFFSIFPIPLGFLPGRLPKSSKIPTEEVFGGGKGRTSSSQSIWKTRAIYFPMIFERIQVLLSIHINLLSVLGEISPQWNFSAFFGFQPLVFSGSTSSSHGPRVNAQQELKATTVTQSTATHVDSCNGKEGAEQKPGHHNVGRLMIWWKM